jgi:hypothetical protein
MEKLEQYRKLVQNLLTEYASHKYPDSDVQSELAFDTTRDHYQVLQVGWERERRIYFVPLHFSIKNGKIWLEQNNTDRLVAEELVQAGVPREDIVLAIHPPYVRPHTGFAVE